ncbi:MAG: phosphatase PAP2 family protein [Hespellia sp.]|nr:phosphatase PAP2 family protein [Hespellia sp.]
MEWILQLDGNILLFIQENIRAEWMNGFWRAVTSLGNAGWLWITISVLLLFSEKTRPIGIAGILSLLIGAFITNIALKNVVARTRPYEVIEGLNILIAKPSDFSFPSGHSCASFAAASAYYRTAPRKFGIPALILATMIAFSRLYVGVHYPTDVIAGILIGLFSAWAAATILKNIKKKRQQYQNEI